jgi:hypothetical protein
MKNACNLHKVAGVFYGENPIDSVEKMRFKEDQAARLSL